MEHTASAQKQQRLSRPALCHDTGADPAEAHAKRLAAGAACLEAALTLYLPLGLVPLCCCDPDHIGVGKEHARTCQKRSWGKAPVHKWKDLQTRLPTADDVTALWRDYPIGNVGCVLGQASGLVRIDVDGPEGEALLEAWSAGDLPPTWTFRSSAHGRGLLYAWPTDRPCKSTARPGVGEHTELRLQGSGSQTILPPSRHQSGSLYTWDAGGSPQERPLAPAPPWLMARLTPTPRAPRTSRTDDRAVCPDRARIEAALARLPNTDDGVGYDTWLTIGMALHSLQTPWARELWEAWSQQSTKYHAAKQDASWASFSADGKVQIATLFYLAHQDGVQEAARQAHGRPVPRLYTTGRIHHPNHPNFVDPWLGKRSEWCGVPTGIRREP